MKDKGKKTLAFILVCVIGALLLIGAVTDVVEVGDYPERNLGEDRSEISYQEALEMYGFNDQTIQSILENKPENFGSRSISEHLLKEVPSEEGTSAANTVTGILWDYRGYDTVGEATVIFTAVAGVVALFRASKDEEEEDEE